MEIILRCGCRVTDQSKFIVGDFCKQCDECTLLENLHPFGSMRLGSTTQG